VDQETSLWQRLETLFAEAVELPRDRQEPFVELHAGSDPELRRRLRSLLDHDTGAGGRIARAIGLAACAASTPLDWTGRRFGPYRVIREIGRGGMGLVFQAVRDDDEYRKTVALKIAPWWSDLGVLRDRFRHERQMLAGLEHPHIARFLDGGTHDGIPYFAMEFVDGVRITEYVRTEGLRPREIVELFRQVCSAVHYAHQSLLVHRDLKPSNILVSKEAVPKLLDFGIAKLLSPLPNTDQNTLTGAAPWTPDYASPEQVRGEPITARTDIYSLGLILFELLTGERGQIADNSSPLTLDRSICKTETPRPSTRAIGSLRRQLTGDLDTIVGMAAHKDPERRYGSVAELSDDLGRYIQGLPVLARKDNVVYRTSKFLQRNWLPVSAGVVAAIGLAGGAISISKAGLLGQKVEFAAKHGTSPNAEAYRHYMTGVYWRGAPSVIRLRRAAIEFGAAVAADSSYAPAQAALAEVCARLYYTETAPAKEFVPTSRAAAARALALDEGLAQAHEAAALIKLIDWDIGGAAREYGRAIQLDPKNGRIRYSYAQLCLSPAGRYQDAADQLRKAIELDPVSMYLITELGATYRMMGDFAAAREQFRKSLDLNPTSIGTRTNLAALDSATGNYAEAVRNLEKINADGPGDPWVMGHLGFAYAKSGRVPDARRTLAALAAASTASMHIAAVYAGLRDSEAALEWLERGVAQKSPSLFWLRSDFRFSELRSLPRYKALAARLP
jgi:serine/threonine protein kinase/tetratricopeptide (TPR) repeat protein